MGAHLKQDRKHEQSACGTDNDPHFHDVRDGSYFGVVCDIQARVSRQTGQGRQNDSASGFLDRLRGLMPGVIQNMMTQVHAMIDHYTDNGRKHHHIDEIKLDMKDGHERTRQSQACKQG